MFEKLLPHQPPRASVRFPQEPWASALRLIVTSDTYFSNGPKMFSFNRVGIAPRVLSVNCHSRAGRCPRG